MLRNFAIVLAASALALPAVARKSTRVDLGGEVERAEREFETTVAKASAAFNETLAKAAEQTLKVVDAEMKAATTRGDLDAAIRLRDKKGRYAALTSRANLVVPVTGVYAAKSTKWGNQDLLLRPDKTFGRPGMGKEHETEGRWEVVSQTLTLVWNDWPPKEMHAVASFSTGDLTMTWKSEIENK